MLFLLYFITELLHTKIKIKSTVNTNTKQFSYISFLIYFTDIGKYTTWTYY